jgi:nucleotide-binding universal stress UspA family protein
MATMEKINKIVVGVDNTELGAGALSRAIALAGTQPNTEVHALRVVEPIVDPLVGALPSTKDELESLKDQLQAAIQNAIAEDGTLRVHAVVAHVAIGAPARAIIELAAQIDAEMIVVGTHGRRGVRRALLGSVAEEVVRRAGCPVLCVRPKQHPEEARIPEIEPLCPDCAKTRFETNNASLWCERHSAHHPRAHVYRYEGPSFDSARPWGFHS